MKFVNAFLVASALMLMACSVKAANYGVTLSASLTTESVSGSTASIHTVPVNNKSIIGAVFASGTTGVLKSSDLALVINSTETLSVINTTSTNSTVVAVIAKTGSNTLQTGVASTSKGNLNLTGALSDYEFVLPGVTGTQVTNFRLTARINYATNAISKLLISFSGGQGDINPGSTYFQGTIKQTSKVYP